MITDILELLVVLAGMVITPVLFYHLPKLPEVKVGEVGNMSVSVIIPARNEEKNLQFLLEDLGKQTLRPYEIICVDDDSTDLTAQIAATSGIRTLSLHNKPDEWIGKSWACQNGADIAKGEILLFLDADVRLSKNALLRLMQAYCDSVCTISVQPFHKTEKTYEQLSILFNFIQIAANGMAMPKPYGVGLYGPVIFISKADYDKIGGHESVKKSIVEDMALAQKIKEKGLNYQLFVGDQDLSFRMYGDGLKTLLQGWQKNMAAGAAKTTPQVFIMVFLWITSLLSVPLHIISYAITGLTSGLVIYSLLYIIWIFMLDFYAKKIGRFKRLAIVFHPILTMFFLVVFGVSMFKKVFQLKVIWKDRNVPTGGKPCE